MNENAPTAPLTLYVVRHPESAEACSIGELLHGHFGPARSRLTTGGLPIRVHFRYAAVPGSLQPAPIRWNDSDTVAVAILIDDALANDPHLFQYANDISQEAETTGFHTRAIPVALSPTALKNGIAVQALRWYEWEADQEAKNHRLIREMTYQFIRMLRHQVSGDPHNGAQNTNLRAYLEKVKVFLSHSKHDQNGGRIAQSIRQWLNDEASLSTFLDVHDIPPGVSFVPAIEENIERSVMAVIYTDSYSSRDACHHEVLYAKRVQVPILVVNCLQNVDERSFPYMGNTPSLRMDPTAVDRMEHVASRLLDEMFKALLWKLHTQHLSNALPNITFLPHSPELVSLITLPEMNRSDEWHIVYPDPPLADQEVQLITALGRHIRLHSLKQWMSEDPP